MTPAFHSIGAILLICTPLLIGALIRFHDSL